MDQDRFATLIHEPEVFSAADRDALGRLAEMAPYSSVVRLLSVLAQKSVGDEPAEAELRQVALMMVGGSALDSRMAAVRQAPVEEEPFDVFRAINDYKEVSFKTAPKSVILSNFLTSDDFNVPQEAESDSLPVTELGKKSISPDNISETETLAVILEKQGRYANAIDVYKKLILKYPEKSSTFAKRITELELLINNK
ncbi:MAG: hypothetical protein IJ789_07545 [Bacteroidales bacterium]|nr:hypothetical protein [Bacteroidales bacterium]